ncbi:uncharacterized protein LOC114174604 [Vigna unguiculata]|uniref:uncharacterized protein LOC114174604 n=1 Tax=Vigna unguiculata TaxID=3917 RepID=UPI001015F669|nr:uncharacterized protein LOC114174604 [Vigna unguiculata]
MCRGLHPPHLFSLFSLFSHTHNTAPTHVLPLVPDAIFLSSPHTILVPRQPRFICSRRFYIFDGSFSIFHAMVRTRGNLSRRGSNDVPESSTQGGARKRPTASARRNRTTGQDEANVVEHDIVENEVSDVPQEDEEGIDNDGGGFPGGPYDTSLLTRYEDHVARMIWDGQDRVVKVVSHIKKVKKLGRPHPSVAPFVLASGLSSLCDILYEYIDLGLVLGFVERWHPETNTFHLPIGEMTITLDDVWSLLHLSISGNFCSTENLEYEESVEILTTLLGVDRAMACVELNQSRGAQV